MESPEALVDLLVSTAVPLVTIDKGELWLVNASAASVHIHLAGAYSGCPGVPYVERNLLAPLVKEVFPRATVTVSSGFPVPKGAKRLEAPT